MLNTEPPSIVRPAERPRQQALRDQAQALAVQSSTNSLDLAWVLGEIRAHELYKSWLNSNGLPFNSFASWLDSDIAAHVPRSTAYELSTIGIYMKGAKDEIHALVEAGKVGTTRLVRLANLVERSKVSLPDAVTAIETDTVLDEERKGEANPEQFIKIPIQIPRGDMPHVQRGLLYCAIRGGHSTIDQAVMDLAIGEAQNLDLPKYAERWLDLIEANQFFCANCGRIPRQPTEHHLIPQSIAQGEGPVCLLDWECHQKIQPTWRSFGEKHLGKKRFHDLLAKYKSRGAAMDTLTCGCADCTTEGATT